MRARSRYDFSIVLYDHECPLCRTEMFQLKRRDTLNRLRLVNVAHPEFDAAAWGFDRAALSAALHARNADGKWLIGMPAIRHVYAQVGLGWLAAPTGWKLLAPYFDRLYRRIALNRLAISRWLGLPVESGKCRGERCHSD